MTDTPTDILNLTELRCTQPDTPAPFWRRISALLAVCSIVTSLLTAGIVAMLVIDPDSATGRNLLIVLASGLTASVIATIGAGLRDYHDARAQASEQRLRTLIQHETYRLEHGQKAIVTAVEALQVQMASLLGPLPQAVAEYGDQRENEGEDRAVRHLSAASGQYQPIPPGTVPRLRSVGPN